MPAYGGAQGEGGDQLDFPAFSETSSFPVQPRETFFFGSLFLVAGVVPACPRLVGVAGASPTGQDGVSQGSSVCFDFVFAKD